MCVEEKLGVQVLRVVRVVPKELELVPELDSSVLVEWE